MKFDDFVWAGHLNNKLNLVQCSQLPLKLKRRTGVGTWRHAVAAGAFNSLFKNVLNIQ